MRERWLDPALTGLVGLFYVGRLYPHLWWGDEPELLAAAWCNGIAHPTGYPLYLLLLKAFFILPLGSVAWKGHLFSTLAILGGVALLFRIVPLPMHFCGSGGPNGRSHANESFVRTRESIEFQPIGWRIGILVLSLVPILSKQAVIAEVYALSFFLVALLLFLSARFSRTPQAATLIWTALAAGIGFGHHRLVGLMLPGLAFLIAGSLHRMGKRGSPALFLGAAGAFLTATFLPYIVIWWRAQGSPPLNWEDPSNLSNLYRVFSGAQFRMDQKVVRAQEWINYQSGTGPHPWLISLWDLRFLPQLWWESFGWSLPLGALGAWATFHRSPRIFFSGFFSWLLPTAFVIQYHVADRETFHLLPLILVGLAVAAGWAYLLDWVGTRKSVLVLPLIPVAGFILFQQMSRLERLPESLSTLPERLANRCYESVPPGGVLLAVSTTALAPVDYTYFPLLYQKEVARRGQNISLISEGFFTTPWYRGALQREGVSPTFFDALQNGTERVPIERADLRTFLREEIPEVQGHSPNRSWREGPVLKIYEVEGRYFLANRYTLAALMADILIPSVRGRPLFFTSKLVEIERYLEEKVEWVEVFRIPILTEGFRDLDGMPVPSGKLYEARLLE